jgi:Domain of unknown function (DUF4136)
MIRTRLFALAITAAVVLLADPALARIDVKIDFDKAFDFSTVRTWRFDPAGNGEVKMARTQKDDPDAVKKVAEPIIVDAVTTEMQQLKLQRADSPDLIVRYFLLLTTNQTAQTMGQFLPGTVAWGLPPFEQTTQSLKLMNQGSLVIDLATSTHVVWRGVAQAKIKFEADFKKREAVIREAVHDLLRRFPPKPQ